MVLHTIAQFAFSPEEHEKLTDFANLLEPFCSSHKHCPQCCVYSLCDPQHNLEHVAGMIHAILAANEPISPNK